VNRFAVLTACHVLFAAAALASGHPTINNRMEIVVDTGHISIRASIPLPEIDIANRIDSASTETTIDRAKLKAAVDAHGPYLLSHLHVSVDDKPVEGKLSRITPPAGEATWARFEEIEAVYEITYSLPIRGR
jgi:hypothetical protein